MCGVYQLPVYTIIPMHVVSTILQYINGFDKRQREFRPPPPLLPNHNIIGYTAGRHNTYSNINLLV